MEQNKLLLLFQVSQHKIIHDSREKSHKTFQTGRCFKTKKYFHFFENTISIVFFSTNNVEKTAFGKKTHQTQKNHNDVFFIGLTPGRRAFWREGVKEGVAIDRSSCLNSSFNISH